MLLFKTSLPAGIRTAQSLVILPVSSVTQLCCGFCSSYRKKNQLHNVSLNSHALHRFSENELQKTMTEDSYSQVTKEDWDRNKEQNYVGCATGQVASHWLLNREAWVQSQASPCRICDWQSGNGARFTPSTSIFPCEYHSTKSLYS